MRFMGHMGWVYEKISRGDGGEFSSHTIFEVGDGSKIRFWHDVVWGLGP